MDKKDETVTLKPKATHPPSRPVTKAPTSRLSTSSTTRPTSTSTATSSAARHTAGSSLSKPPARPAAASTTVRKPSATASVSSIATHKKRESDTSVSVDEKPSGDEKSKDGISAKPKRMSLAPSTTSDRASASKSVAATPARRTSMQPAATSSQQPGSSPIGARKVAATPSTARTLASTSSATRSRPLASSSRSVATGALAERKRLSTIPASPAVKTGIEDPEDNKENASSAVEEKAAGTARPALESRKSTRSLLIEQRIREFELVNSMLQAAMTADGADEQEQQSMNQDAASKIAKLKSDLAKVREFERTHSRVPTAAELEELQSVAEETALEPAVEAVENIEAAAATEPQDETIQSQAQVAALQAELIDLKAKLEQFSKSAEEESLRVHEATEAIRNEHAAKIDQLSSLHETKLSEMKSAHQEEVRGHDSKKDQLSLQLALAQEEIERSKLELEELRNAAAEQASTQNSNAELQEELRTKIATLEATYQSQLAESQSKLDELATDVVNKQKEIAQQQEELAKVNAETSRQNEVIVSLKNQVLEFQQARDEESNARVALVRELENQIKDLQQEKADANAAAASSLAAVEEAHTEELEAIKRQLGDAQEELKKAQNSQESELQKVLKKSEADLGAANAELESYRASHSSRIQDLEAQLQKTKDEAEAKRASHEGALAALQSQVDAAKTALDQATASHEQILKDHEAKSESAREELAALKSLHQKELESLLSGSQAKQEEEVATLKSAHAEQIQQLEQKLHDFYKEVLSLKQTHSSQIKQLEDHMNASLKDLESIEAGHVQQLDRVKSEASESQQRAVEEAEKIHIERVRTLEQQLNAAEAELADAKSTHLKQLEVFEQKRATEHEIALNALKESHATMVMDLEGQLKSAQASMQTIKVEHAKQLSHLEEQISSRHAETITSLKAEHARQLEDIESKAKSFHEEALNELRSSLADEKRQLESQTKSLQEELEGNRFQTQMVKSILENTEKDAKEKEEELNEALEKLKADMSTSVIKLARMSELQMEHDQILEAKKGLEARVHEEMGALRAEHEKALAELENTLKEQHEQAIEKVREEHAKSVESSQAANESQFEELKKKMKGEHDSQLDEIMKTLESQWKTQVDQLEEQNAAASARLAEAEKQHEQAWQKVKLEHEAALTRLQAELQGARNAAESGQSSTAQLEELQTQLAEAQGHAKEVEKNHHGAMVLANEERESALAAMKQELIAAKEAAAQRPDPSQLEELNKKYTDAQKELAALQEKHDHAIREARAEYDTQLEKAFTELNDAKLAAERAPDSERVDGIKATLDEAKKTIASLEADLEGAMLEIETQRNLAESASKDAERFKAEATSLSSPKPAEKPVNTTSPRSPKQGLESSRWAKPGEAASEATGATTEETAPGAATNGKSLNVAGQLAGIQEQIRQLDDLSEDFLEEHQKMAGILSRVDDETQTPTADVEKDDEDLD
ncbi:uncharacterized protein A1O5_07240 [Cladophialophora psammophila CBS 110553]|uniref:M protein repeat protein n=1 Tax=Cladophialophora psammophila CBS 110553 TaxID=1182543 RepID=W9XFP6_9EURO|nr:uncharacterized protein A1O5_07240 [Cladophialophora psammophila CBS 110553]EXJ69204.1 hypothetical protein A1O5_07240 [Cladophialophora psammophila CBS 110553]